MSADNGIYILKCKDQSRVIYTSNIENLWFSFLTWETTNELVSTRLVEYFGMGQADSYSHKKAIKIAHKMYEDFMEKDDFGILEYGISTISIDKTWREIISEALDLGIQEIRSIINSDEWSGWIDDIKTLLDMYEDNYRECWEQK